MHVLTNWIVELTQSRKHLFVRYYLLLTAPFISHVLLLLICLTKTHVGEENFGRAYLYDSLKFDSEQELYPRCARFTELSATLKLYSLKVRNWWTNNTLPIYNLEAKKVLLPMSLEYQKIHACSNDCVLYREEFVSLKVCPTCDLLWFKKKIDVNSGDEEKEVHLLRWCRTCL